jgi:D-aminopeptidase
MRPLRRAWAAGLALAALAVSAAPEPRPRIRDLGVTPGILPPGPLDAITDVAGVRVGQKTLVRGDSVRTGVTAILPHGGNLFQQKVPAAVFVGNGYGKAAGFLQVQELGTIETPIVLTNTLAVGTAVEAVVRWTLAQPGNEGAFSVNAVVGETNDFYLNDIRSLPVTGDDVRAAIAAAAPGPVEEGSVGAGTGTRALGWKGGIGTASRVLPKSLGGYTVGALVQSNFGGVLTIDGIRVGERLGRYTFKDELERERSAGEDARRREGGSCMIVLATDAPLSVHNLERLAKRAVLGLARVGSYMNNSSGDFVIAFSTRNLVPHEPKQPTRAVEELENEPTGPLFLAVVEAVEEALYNSLVKATDVTGYQGHTTDAIPIDRLRELLAERKGGGGPGGPAAVKPPGS